MGGCSEKQESGTVAWATGISVSVPIFFHETWEQNVASLLEWSLIENYLACLNDVTPECTRYALSSILAVQKYTMHLLRPRYFADSAHERGEARAEANANEIWLSIFPMYCSGAVHTARLQCARLA